MKKRFTSALFVCCFLAAALFFLGPTQASAKAEWPNNTVNIVVGYNPRWVNRYLRSASCQAS